MSYLPVVSRHVAHTVKIEMDSIHVVQQCGTTRWGNATHCEPSLSIYIRTRKRILAKRERERPMVSRFINRGAQGAVTGMGQCSSQTTFLLLQCWAQERAWRAARSYVTETNENCRLTETFTRNFVTDTNVQQWFAADTALFVEHTPNGCSWVAPARQMH